MRRPPPTPPPLPVRRLIGIEDSGRSAESRERARLASRARAAAPPLRLDRPRALLLRDPLRPGGAAQLRRVRAAVGGGVRRVARVGRADRVAVVPRLRRLAAVRRPRRRPRRDPPDARGQHARRRGRARAERRRADDLAARHHLRRHRVARLRRRVRRRRVGRRHVLVHRPPRRAPHAANDDGTPAPAAAVGLRGLARSRGFWSLAAPFFVCGITTTGFVDTHLIPLAQDRGIPAATAGLAVALLAAAALTCLTLPRPGRLRAGAPPAAVEPAGAGLT